MTLSEDWKNRILAQINSNDIDDLLAAASLVERKLSKSKGEFYNWLKNTVGNLTCENKDLISSILDLNTPLITTNYDSLVEQVSSFKPATWQEPHLVEEALRKNNSTKDNYVFHLHGHWERPSSVILGLESYRDVMKDEHAQTMMKSARSLKTLLFIGFGAGISDPNFKALRQWSSEVFKDSAYSHYRLALDSEVDQVQAEHDPQERIKVISYGKEHNDLTKFIQSLRPAPVQGGSKKKHRSSDNGLDQYLTWLIEKNRWIEIRGLKYDTSLKVELEQVYVGLKVDSAHPYERAIFLSTMDKALKQAFNSKSFLPEKILNKIKEKLGTGTFITPESLHYLMEVGNLQTEEIEVILQRLNELEVEIYNSLQHLFKHTSQNRTASISIGEAYRKHQHLVILGDPGSGKTTIAKWLALKMSMALKEGKEKLSVLCTEIDAEEDGADRKAVFILGKARLPILISTWQYAEYRKKVKSEDRTLLAYLKFYAETERINFELFEKHIKLFNALIILDGLDEVPSQEDRNSIIDETHDFLDQLRVLFHGKAGSDPNYFTSLVDPDLGNRLIVTSRIVGNYSSRISVHIPRLTIENMTLKAVELFCNTWIYSIVKEDFSNRALTAGELDKRSAQISEGLYKAIISQESILQMAKNPQLAGVIASLYYTEKHLPEHKVKLYQKAIQNITGNWKKRSPDAEGLNEHEIFDIVESVAEYMHGSTGSIKENKLREIVTERLAELRSKNYSAPDLMRAADRFITIIKKDVGLLALFGENEYRFLHRSFQEYLAARSIVKDPNTAVSRLKERLYDPIWREPLLMALGHLSVERPGRIKEITVGLLQYENELDDLLPRTTFLITDGLKEMDMDEVKEEKEIVSLLIQSLFHIYSNKTGLGRFHSLQHLTEAAFDKIRNNGYERILSAFMQAALKQKATAPIAAQIIHRLNWFLPQHVQLLQDALKFDSKEWNFSIDASLRKIVTGTVEDANSQSAYFATERLTFRRELAFHPQLVELICTDIRWFQLIIAIYGGYKDYNTPQAVQEYYEIASYLQLADYERRPFEPYYGLRWGKDDTSYNMAVHLDTHGHLKPLKFPPQFEVTNIYKDSPLTPYILDELKSATPAISNLQAILYKLLSGHEETEREDACLALLALGEDIKKLDDIYKRNAATDIHRLQERMYAISTSLADPVVRASSKLADDLKMFQQHIREQQTIAGWRDFENLVASALSITTENGAPPVNTFDLISASPVYMQAYILSEFLASNFTGVTNDSIYTTALALDNFNSSNIEREVLVSSLAQMGKAKQLKMKVFSYNWPVEALVPVSVKADDIPLAAFTAIENVHREISMVRYWVLGQNLRNFIKVNPQLLPELLIIGLSDTGDRSQRADIFTSLAPGLVDLPDARHEILRMAKSLSNPYYKCRALIRISKHFAGEEVVILEEVLALAGKIDNFLEKAQVYERLLTELPQSHEKWNKLIESMEETIENIPSAADRAVMLGKFVFYVPHNKRRKLNIQCLKAISEITTEKERAETLLALLPQLITDEALDGLLEQLDGTFNDEMYKSVVKANHGKILDAVFSRYSYIPNESLNRWAVITMAAKANYVLNWYNHGNTVERLWLQLRTSQSRETLNNLLGFGAENHLIFSRTAALVLDGEAHENGMAKFTDLFPYLVNPEPETIPVLKRWLSYENENVKNIAKLILAEKSGLSIECVGSLVILLDSKNDLIRHRASRIIHHPSLKHEPIRLVSIVNAKTIEALTAELLKAGTNLHIRVKIGWMYQDLLFDDPAAMNRWIQDIQKNNSNAKVARLIIRNVKAITVETWNIYLNTIRNCNSLEVFTDIFLSACSLHYEARLTVEMRHELIGAINDMPMTLHADKLFLPIQEPEFIDFLKGLDVSFYQDREFIASVETKLDSGCSFLLRHVPEIAKTDSERLLATMHNIGKASVSAGPNYFEESLDASEKLLDDPVIFYRLTEWLSKLLQSGVMDEERYYIRSYLLTVISVLTIQKPILFATKMTDEENSKEFDKDEFRLNLILAAKRQNSFTGRRAAVTLLGYLPEPDEQVIDTLLHAMMDIDDVQLGALHAVKRFQGKDLDELLPPVYKNLYHESTLVAYASCQLLETLGLSDNARASHRLEIQGKLAEAIRNPLSSRYVHFYYVDAKVPNMPKLDQAFFDVMMKISGMG